MNKILRADRTLYLLNDKGDENTFSAFVQPGREKTIGEALELAKDIERCVNSHEALVKALEDCVRVFENELSGLAVIGPELRQACAALAAAKKQP